MEKKNDRAIQTNARKQEVNLALKSTIRKETLAKTHYWEVHHISKELALEDSD